MFPSHPCAFDQSSHLTSVIAPLPTVSAEFLQLLIFVILLYHLVNFLILFILILHFLILHSHLFLHRNLLLLRMLYLLDIPLGCINLLPTLGIITVILFLLQSWPQLHSTPLLIRLQCFKFRYLVSFIL